MNCAICGALAGSACNEAEHRLDRLMRDLTHVAETQTGYTRAQLADAVDLAHDHLHAGRFIVLAQVFSA